MVRRWSSLLVLTLALLPFERARADAPAEPSLRFSAYQVKEGTFAGELAGQVTLTAAVPKTFPIKHTRDQNVCGDGAPDDSLLVDDKGGVANAIVLLDIPSGRKLEPRKDATLDQRGCTYQPRIQAVPLGSTIAITNNDPLLHTVHSWLGDVSVFNKAEPLKGDRKPVELKKAGLLTVKCDIHNWMRAYLAVVPHPYFAVTDAHGAFHIAGIPAGEYPVQVWHERLGLLEAKAKIPEKGPVTLDFKYAAVP